MFCFAMQYDLLTRRGNPPKLDTRLFEYMSALGQKQTCAVQKGTSALPQIATAKADLRKHSCPLYPRKRTCAFGISDLGHKRTPGQFKLALLFDDLVSEAE
jgi:hypothetical protein